MAWHPVPSKRYPWGKGICPRMVERVGKGSGVGAPRQEGWRE